MFETIFGMIISFLILIFIFIPFPLFIASLIGLIYCLTTNSARKKQNKKLISKGWIAFTISGLVLSIILIIVQVLFFIFIFTLETDDIYEENSYENYLYDDYNSDYFSDELDYTYHDLYSI